MSHAAINMHVSLFLWADVFLSVRYIAVQLLGHMVTLHLIFDLDFLEHSQWYFSSKGVEVRQVRGGEL